MFRGETKRKRLATPMFLGEVGQTDVHLYNKSMSKKVISSGVVHNVPADLRKALVSDAAARAKWEDITPLARNEWICWVISVKLAETRKQHVERVCSELKEGMRRPCCWAGCPHRTDKKLSPSQKFVLSRKARK
jgi:hypothetical protein